MAEFYKVLTAEPLGDPYSAHGKMLQNFWCQFEGVDKAVSLSKQVPNTPQLGGYVYGNLMYAKSQKGNEYWKFKSEKVPDGMPRPASTPAQATAQAAVGQTPNTSSSMPDWFMPIANQIDYIFREMRKMDSEAPENQQPPVQTTAPELEVAGEPLDPDTAAQIEDIFGKPAEAPEPEKE